MLIYNLRPKYRETQRRSQFSCIPPLAEFMTSYELPHSQSRPQSSPGGGSRELASSSMLIPSARHKVRHWGGRSIVYFSGLSKLSTITLFLLLYPPFQRAFQPSSIIYSQFRAKPLEAPCHFLGYVSPNFLIVWIALFAYFFSHTSQSSPASRVIFPLWRELLNIRSSVLFALERIMYNSVVSEARCMSYLRLVCKDEPCLFRKTAIAS